MQDPAKHKIFSNLAIQKIPSFYTEDGEVNYKEIALVFLKLTKDDLAKIANISVKSVRFDGDMPSALKEHISAIKNVCELAAEMLHGEISKTQLWFTTKNQMLGNISPRDMIRYGRYQKLLDILMDIKNGNIP